VILVVGNIKGGVGKTTLAVNIAVERSLADRDVLLVDGDEQRTAMTFTQLRQESELVGYTSVALYGAALRTQVRLMAAKFADIVIDVGGGDSTSFRAGLTVADALLVPVAPRTFDLWSIERVAELVAEARELNERLAAWSVLNQADPNGSDNGVAAGILERVGAIRYLNMPIVRRKAWPNAAAAGKSILEGDDEKAIAEFKRMLAVLYGAGRKRAQRAPSE